MSKDCLDKALPQTTIPDPLTPECSAQKSRPCKNDSGGDECKPNERNALSVTRKASLYGGENFRQSSYRKFSIDYKQLAKDGLNQVMTILKNIKVPPPPGPGAPTGRPMRFPYTFAAKIAQFPWMFYYHNNWICKYFCYAVVVSIPIFWKISRMSNSKANKAKWREIRRREKAGHH